MFAGLINFFCEPSDVSICKAACLLSLLMLGWLIAIGLFRNCIGCDVKCHDRFLLMYPSLLKW
jgi:hypothetical protein